MKSAIAILLVPIVCCCVLASCNKKSDDDKGSDTPPPAGTTPTPTPTPDTVSTAGTLAISPMEQSLETLPAYSSVDSSYDETTTGELLPGTLVIDTSPTLMETTYAIGDVVDNFALRTFFRYECFGGWGPKFFNYCPAELDLPPGNNTEDYPYMFTSTALAGHLQGAENFMRRIYPFRPDGDKCTEIIAEKGTTCEACYAPDLDNCLTDYENAACYAANKCFAENRCTSWYYCTADDDAITSISINSEIDTDKYTLESTTGYGGSSDSSGDPAKYMIPVTGYYNRIAPLGVENVLAHLSENQQKYVMLYTSKHMEGMSGAGAGKNHDVLQSFLVLGSDGGGKLLAVNETGIRDRDDSTEVSGGRTVLIQSFSSGKFIVKNRTVGIASAGSEIIAIGKGGRDKTTGALKDGNYYVEVHYEGQHIVTGCIDNATQKLVADTNCATEKTLWDGSFDVASYLDLTTEEATDLAGFVAFLDDATRISDDQIPTSSADVVNFPDKISEE